MKVDCEIIRDLLPLYADDACSGKSRAMVEEHLVECDACRGLLIRMQDAELETGLREERDTVLRHGEKRFKRRSTLAGSIVAGIFMIPLLICLIINLNSGAALSWFYVVLASMLVAASLIIVPILAPEDKLFWTFCAFTASLMVLLAVVCYTSGGTWFWIAASSTLFGLAVIFLPFVVKAKPVQRLIGNCSRVFIVLGLDVALFVNMLNAITSRNRFSFSSVLFILAALAGVAMVVLEVMKKRGNLQ